eukprot:10984310-Alexandrium_andersonii.AAC.1
MSASLVGSEMCIRDSAHSTTVPIGGQRVSAHGACAHALVLAALRPANTCLLYTSDAADDM